MALAAMVLAFAPARAAQVVCEINGDVELSVPVQAGGGAPAQGKGAFKSSSTFICTGGLGLGTPAPADPVTSPNFAFCGHNQVTPTTNPACHGTGNNGPRPSLDPVYDNVASVQTALASHFLSPNPATINFAVGSCTLDFEGHAIIAQAEIVIHDFSCSGLGISGLSGNATADAIPFLGATPCPPPGVQCFKELKFIGTLEVS